MRKLYISVYSCEGTRRLPVTQFDTIKTSRLRHHAPMMGWTQNTCANFLSYNQWPHAKKKNQVFTSGKSNVDSCTVCMTLVRHSHPPRAGKCENVIPPPISVFDCPDRLSVILITYYRTL